MCLILFAVQPDLDTPLIVAANRDEFHARATARADFWETSPDILGGRDLVAGGTWLGVTRNGRFAAVTNFAETPPEPMPPRSRGELTANFLQSNMGCRDYLESVAQQAQQYRGFNLLTSDGREVYYFSNRENRIRALAPGYYGLSNQLLDCDWPKVVTGRAHLTATLQENVCDAQLEQELFKLLADRGDDTPRSARFILGDTYGTGVSTALIYKRDYVRFSEKAFTTDGDESGQKSYEIKLGSTAN
jgi:uncharacterized protein with NRDE domain